MVCVNTYLPLVLKHYAPTLRLWPTIHTVAQCNANDPRTTHGVQRSEWGNPAEMLHYRCMMGYCPMDNVRDGVEYPDIFATAGLHDPWIPCA